MTDKIVVGKTSKPSKPEKPAQDAIEAPKESKDILVRSAEGVKKMTPAEYKQFTAKRK